MNNDKSTRLITLGEAHIDPERHVIYNPLHNYDEDVEFVTDISKVKAGNFFYCRTSYGIR
jgi:hypothetical protein